MGASYGTLVSTVVESWTNPDVVPKTTDKPKHDPTFGFSNERTPRGFSYTFFPFIYLEEDWRFFFLSNSIKKIHFS
jgi:hypothetical protein